MNSERSNFCEACGGVHGAHRLRCRECGRLLCRSCREVWTVGRKRFVSCLDRKSHPSRDRTSREEENMRNS